MNVVPFDPAPMVRGAFRAAPAGFAADAAYNLARQYGPRLANYALRNFGRLGMRAAREAWRRWGPRPQTFMDRARLALGRAQRTAVRRRVDRLASRRGSDFSGGSNRVSQIRGSRGTVVAARRGGYSANRGGGRLRRRPMRYGGRPFRRPELKSFDTSTNNPITTTCQLIQVPVRDITLGTHSNQRIGRKVFVKSLLVAGKIYSTSMSTSASTSDSVWFWVVLDRQPNGANAAATDVWSNTLASTALRNLDQGPRFKILKCVEIKVDAVAVDTHVNQPFEFYLPLGFTVHWTGTADQPPTKNNLLLFVANSNGADAILACQYVTRVRFTDV